MSDDLALEREVAHLRMALDEARSENEGLRDALDRRRTQETSRVSDTVSSLQHDLMVQVAAPVAQLMTQAHMLEKEGRTLQARDVMAVSRRIVHALRDAGLTLRGEVGEAAAYDATQHEPLGEARPAGGQAIVIRMPGVSFQGQVLRRAGVVPS